MCSDPLPGVCVCSSGSTEPRGPPTNQSIELFPVYRDLIELDQFGRSTRSRSTKQPTNRLRFLHTRQQQIYFVGATFTTTSTREPNWELRERRTSGPKTCRGIPGIALDRASIHKRESIIKELQVLYRSVRGAVTSALHHQSGEAGANIVLS